MKKQENFKIIDGCGVCRLSRDVTMQQGVALVTEAIAYARIHDLQKLMIVASDITRPKATVTEKYFFVREWAAAASPTLRLAMVAHPEMIDPKKFGVTVAANSGLIGDVFTTEAEALAWLQACK